MEARPGIYCAFVSLAKLFAFYRLWAWFFIKSQKRRRRKQAVGMEVPFVAVECG